MTDQLDTVTQAALAKAGAEARQAFGTKTAGILDTLKSIDWKKHVGTKSDARNALIGSALGGLALGGASLLSDRDPEESKATPVGDALLGAILGGAAGYGIPRGLHLFAHGNDADTSTAKPGGGVLSAIDNRLTKWFGPDSKIPLWSKGYLTGALGLGMAGAREADWRLARLRASHRLATTAENSWGIKYMGAREPWQTALRNLSDAKNGVGAANRGMLDAIDKAKERLKLVTDGKTPGAMQARLAALRKNLAAAKASGDTAKVEAIQKIRLGLQKARHRAQANLSAAQSTYDRVLATLQRTADTSEAKMKAYNSGSYRQMKTDLENRIRTTPDKGAKKELKTILKTLNSERAEAKRGRKSRFTSAGRASITKAVGQAEPKLQGKITRTILGPSDRYRAKPEAVLPGRGVKGQSRWNRARGGLLGLGVGGLLDYALGEVAKRNAGAAKSGK